VRQVPWGRRRRRRSLRVHLDSALVGAGLAHDPAVVGERSSIRLVPDLLEQLGRAFDIGEEEGDRAGREIRSHAT
jgi:hypothetical protein